MREISPEAAPQPKPRRRRLLSFTLVRLLQVGAWLLLAESAVGFGSPHQVPAEYSRHELYESRAHHWQFREQIRLVQSAQG